jgi:predicted DsbA family dithiol-disulfide isomerase
MTTTLTVDVYVDLICPWCLIGKRHLSCALAELAREQPDVAVQLNWHGVQLIPQVPAQGWPFAEFYERRLGGKEAVRQRQQQVQQAALQAGLVLDLASIAVFPNTGRALRLLEHVTRTGSPAQVEAVIERLFAAYFLRGENLGEPAILVQIARECGLDVDTLPAELFAADAPLAPLSTPMPPQGVPYFVFNRRLALAGAHPSATLLAAMHEALQGPERLP